MSRSNTPPFDMDPPIAGSSAAVRELKRLIVRLASAEVTVLVTGESGVGKELVARNLHRHSRRRSGPFVPVNCAALNPGVLESELFGHGRGSFTGAVQAHAGLFEQAHGGTLLLDEIGDVPPHIQPKLLRVLQDREVRRMGSAQTRRVDVRVIAATNADLGRKIKEGVFREDLFYRLNVVEIHVPPLRERVSDLDELIGHFYRARGQLAPLFDKDARDLVSRYGWPGNIRELENELERLLALHPGTRTVTPAMLSGRLKDGHGRERLDVGLLYESPLPDAVCYLEKNVLRRTLEQTNWNKSRTARKLGLSRQGLLKKIKRYGITAGGAETDEAS